MLHMWFCYLQTYLGGLNLNLVPTSIAKHIIFQFISEHLMTLKNSGKIAGVVVLNQTDTTLRNPAPKPPYSNDLTCPNKITGL